ncbi:hypothetical protein [Sphingomonas sp. AX6]|uniref:hypothetical protein n=1 Tax=Sphingomonas sp. AX6 TaxID=2653171 RepID=UPI0012F32B79|nr:hypothetical protein [Sphingomonas sp. AX6]VXD00830.1 hypothetical protein SPHINGOAX6_71065 [Sphingomonas sp. AX6]
MTKGGGGVSRHEEDIGGSTHLAEIFMRCADYADAQDDAALIDFLRHAATAADAGKPLPLGDLDAIFAPDGALRRASIAGGWDEEYIGLAAAYRSETAGMRD